MQNKKEKNHLVEVIYFLSNKVICLHPALYLLTCCFSLGKKGKAINYGPRGERPRCTADLAALAGVLPKGCSSSFGKWVTDNVGNPL